MNNQIINSYEKQLPSYRPISFWSVFGRFSAGISIIAAGYGFYYKPQTIPESVYAIFLCSLIVFLFGYIFFRESQKQHRYSEAIVFVAHTSHLIKDFKYGRAGEPELRSLQIQLADTISKCFTLLKGRKCSVCIKTLEEDGELISVARDSNSSIRYSDIEESKMQKHYLKDNTDFSELFENTKEYGRYFVENDLKSLWKSRKYKNSSFQIVTEPKIRSFFKYFHYVANWKLGYKSTLVCPIRHITTVEYPSGDYKHYWGFLCIDANSRGAFNEGADPELAYCFANQIYTLSGQIREVSKLNNEISDLYKMIDELTAPEVEGK